MAQRVSKNRRIVSTGSKINGKVIDIIENDRLVNLPPSKFYGIVLRDVYFDDCSERLEFNNCVLQNVKFIRCDKVRFNSCDNILVVFV